MTDNNEQPAAALGLPDIEDMLDPSNWPDPKEVFSGKVAEFEIRPASPEFMVKFWDMRKVTNPPTGQVGELQQLNIVVHRLDTIRFRPSTGEELPDRRFCTVDMQYWDRDKQEFVRSSARQSKFDFVIKGWRKAYGQLKPASRLIDTMADFEFYPTKTFGTATANRLLVPTAVLPPSFTFDGEVRRIPIREEEGETGAEATAATDDAVLMSETLEWGTLVPYLVGKKVDDLGGIISAIPEESRIAPVLTAISSGELFETLAETGLITITDGVIATA